MPCTGTDCMPRSPPSSTAKAAGGQRGVSASAAAVPIPPLNPVQNPPARLRWMHSTPIGPTGTATARPSRMPRRNRSSVEASCGGSCTGTAAVFLRGGHHDHGLAARDAGQRLDAARHQSLPAPAGWPPAPSAGRTSHWPHGGIPGCGLAAHQRPERPLHARPLDQHIDEGQHRACRRPAGSTRAVQPAITPCFSSFFRRSLTADTDRPMALPISAYELRPKC